MQTLSMTSGVKAWIASSTACSCDSAGCGAAGAAAFSALEMLGLSASADPDAVSALPAVPSWPSFRDRDLGELLEPFESACGSRARMHGQGKAYVHMVEQRKEWQKCRPTWADRQANVLPS